MQSGHSESEGLVIPATCLSRFEVRRILSRGGMGVVCVAWDRVCGRLVALKFLRSEIVDHPESNDRLVREATIMARLSHPGVPSVYDMGVDDAGRAWYAMRLIEGRELRAEINSCHESAPRKVDRHWSDLRRLLMHLIDVAKTVHWAHDAGFLHRDLKPANIFVSRHGESVLLDWGLAGRIQAKPRPSDQPISTPEAPEIGSSPVDDDFQTDYVRQLSTSRTSADSATRIDSSRKISNDDEMATVGQFDDISDAAESSQTELTGSEKLPSRNRDGEAVPYVRVLDSDLTNHLARLGTPAYMAPEMRDGRFSEVDRRTDVFLLGATLYQTLVGEPPFSRSARTAQDLRQSLIKKNIASDLVEICQKAMQSDMSLRYADAKRFADDLEQYLADEAILARADDSVRKAGRIIRRHWRWASAGALLLIFATGLIGLLLVLQQRTKGFELKQNLMESQQLAIELESDQRLREVEVARLYRDVDAFGRTVSQHDAGWSQLASDQVATLVDRVPLDRELLAKFHGERLRMMLGFDVRSFVPVEATNNGTVQFAPGCFAYEPKSNLMAIGQAKAGMYIGLKLVVGSAERQHWDAVANLSIWQGAKDFFSKRPQPGYRAVCFSPDGQYLYAGTRSGELFRWRRADDSATGNWVASGPQQTLLRTDGTIKALEVSSDGKAIFIATDQHWLQRLVLDESQDSASIAPVEFEGGDQELIRAENLISRRMPQNLREIFVLASGALAISPSEGSLIDSNTLQDTDSPKTLYKVATPHPNGSSLVASGLLQELFYVDPETGRTTEALSGGTLSDSLRNVHQSISGDGCWLARTVQWTDGAQLEIWNLMNSQLQCTLPLESELEPCVQFEAGRPTVWVAGDVPRLFEINPATNGTGHSETFASPIREIAGGENMVLAVVDDETWLLNDRLSGSFKLETSSMELAAISRVGEAADGSVLAITYGNRRQAVNFLSIGNTAQNSRRAIDISKTVEMAATIEAMEYDGDGTLWCALHGTGIESYSIVGIRSDGKIVGKIQPPQLIDVNKSLEPTSICIINDRIMVGLRTGQIDIFDRVEMKAINQLRTDSNSRILAIKARPTNKDASRVDPMWIVCAQRDASLRLMPVTIDGESNPLEVQHFSTGVKSPVLTMCWLSPDLLAYSRSNGTFEIVDINKPESGPVLTTRFDKPLTSLVVEGQRLAIHFAGDRAVRYIDKQMLLSLVRGKGVGTESE